MSFLPITLQWASQVHYSLDTGSKHLSEQAILCGFSIIQYTPPSLPSGSLQPPGHSKKSNPANNRVFIKGTGAEGHASDLGINAIEAQERKRSGD